MNRREPTPRLCPVYEKLDEVVRIDVCKHDNHETSGESVPNRVPWKDSWGYDGARLGTWETSRSFPARAPRLVIVVDALGECRGAGGSDKGRTMQDVQQHEVVRIRESRESSESDVEYLRNWALSRDREAAVRAVSARTEELISTTGAGYALSN